MAKVYATPGVYIEEKSAFPNSAVPVATAVPAFIGYTEKAIRNKKDLTNVPTRISSFGEYLLYFGEGPKTVYDIAKADDPLQIYKLQNSGGRFLLYYSMKLFFANGGSDCYIVSIGNYSTPDAPALAHFDAEDEDKVSKEIVLKGMRALLQEPEPTMVVIPEAVLLSPEDCASLQQRMLLHCQKMASRFSILDVYMDENAAFAPDTRDIVEKFRTAIGINALQWGASYYPFLETSITGAEEVDFTNINPAKNGDLIAILTADVDETEKERLLDAKRATKIRLEIQKINSHNLNTLAAAAATANKTAADTGGLFGKAETAVSDAQGKVAGAQKAIDENTDAAALAGLQDALKTEQGKLKEAQDALKKQRDADPAKTIAYDAAKREEALAIRNDKRTALANAKKAVPQVAADVKKASGELEEAEKAFAAVAPDVKTLHQTLLAISPLYKSIMESLRGKLNLLPPSAGMAGIYSMVDHQIGVFQSPANISIGSVVKPWVNLTNEDQDDLNVPLDGKAVNAIRTFPGKGVLVWGARTLDGNSQDWRYVSVRRTVIFIEQSVKYACGPYVFAPNTSSTWTNVKAMITNFLTNVWQSGALAGSTPAEAFSVDVGLGSTMTPVDILDGYMRVTVKIAVTRPAEFIVITFQQKMQES